MSRNEKELRGVNKLGEGKTDYKSSDPSYSMLETFINKHPGQDYLVSFKCPEFSSLCPKTAQPDFATMWLQYIPDKKLVESKSLKLYMFAFRNHGDFHEDCTNQILEDVVKVISPKFARVIGDYTPRGGISICTVAEYIKRGYKVQDHIIKLPELHTRHL